MIDGIMVKALLNDIPGDQFPSHLGLFIIKGPHSAMKVLTKK